MEPLLQMMLQYGIPTALLVFIFIYFLKPFFEMHLRTFNKLVETLSSMNESLHEMKSNINAMQDDIKNIKQKLP